MTRQLKEARLNALMESCKQEVLKQIIGPFGLNPAMFNDVDGGDVTTTRNFEKGVTANKEDAAKYQEYLQNQKNTNRDLYDKDLPRERKELFQSQETISSAYTGKTLSKDGQTHLDHVVSAAQMERNPKANLYMSPEQRAATANHKDNLVPAESGINQSMGDKGKREWADEQRKKDPGKTNAESFGVDKKKLNEVVDKAEAHVNSELLKAQLKKQGGELLSSGAKAAAKNAVRAALGVLLGEFVQHAFHEIKRLLKQDNDEANLIDQIVQALRRVMQRVMAKFKDAWDALIDGGVQGFLSTFITYLINCVVTTSAKVVTIIREGMKGLWDAIKVLVNPPEGMSTPEAARQATKIIAGVITMGLGMMLEESINGFILSMPIFAPLADVIAPALTGLITGVMTAVVIYGLDSLFDWLSSTGTELLVAMEKQANASIDVVNKLEQFINEQYRNSQLYEALAKDYRRINQHYAQVEFSYGVAAIHASESISIKNQMIEQVEKKFELGESIDTEFVDFIATYHFQNGEPK